MFRRVMPIALVISALLFSLVFLTSTQVMALTATPQPPTITPTRTVTRTVTPVVCNPMPPTYYVTVSPSAANVEVGGQITVTVTSNVGIASYSLTVIDNATGVTQSQTDPIFTPAPPASQTPPGGVYTVQWTLTAVRAGSVTLGASAFGEIQVCSNGSLFYTNGGAGGHSGTVTVGTTPTLTSTPFIAGDLGYGTVSGKVTDASTGAAIAGAVVTCSHSTYNPIAPCSGTRTTATDGTYSFTNVFFHDTDRITVSVAAAGYVSQSVMKNPFTSAGMTANFALAASSGSLPDLTVLSITEFTYTLPTATANAQGCWPSGPYGRIGIRVTVQNIGTADAGTFVVDLNGVQGTIGGITAGQTLTLDFTGNFGRTRTATADSTGVIAESNETNNAYTLVLPPATGTPTGTPPPVLCITRTPTPTVTRTGSPTITRTPTITLTPSRTPTQGTGTCSPISATIAAPFTKDGAGTFCWQSSNLGTYINSWNTTSVTINGVNISNVYIAAGSYPAKIGGFWYVTYNSSVAWGHFEAK